MTFPFILIGNKIDRESERKVTADMAKRWCKSNGDIPYIETSAKENVSVDEAFMEMSKKAIKKEGGAILMPDSIGMAAGAIKLNKQDDTRRTMEKQKKKSCSC